MVKIMWVLTTHKIKILLRFAILIIHFMKMYQNCCDQQHFVSPKCTVQKPNRGWGMKNKKSMGKVEGRGNGEKRGGREEG